MVRYDDDYLADLIARGMLGLPLEGELNLPSRKDLLKTQPQQQALPIQLPQTVPLTQAPSAPIITGKEEGWLPILGKAIGGGLLTPFTGTAGALSAVGERFGIDTKELRDTVSELESKLTPKIGKSKAKKYAYAILNSTVNSAFQFLLSRLTGIPLLPMFGVTSGGEKYLQLRQAGVPHTKAIQSAVPTGYSEALTEKLPYEALFKDIGKPLIKRLLKLFGGEVIGENINTLTENIADQVALGKHKTLQDYINDAVETTIVTLGQTALTGGLGLGAPHILKRLEHKHPSLEKKRGTIEKKEKTATGKTQAIPYEPDYSKATIEQIASDLSNLYTFVESQMPNLPKQTIERNRRVKQALQDISVGKTPSPKNLKLLEEDIEQFEGVLPDVVRDMFKYHIRSLARKKGKKRELALKALAITPDTTPLADVPITDIPTPETPLALPPVTLLGTVPSSLALPPALPQYLPPAKQIGTQQKEKDEDILAGLGYRKHEIPKLQKEIKSRILKEQIPRNRVVFKKTGEIVVKGEKPKAVAPLEKLGYKPSETSRISNEDRALILKHNLVRNKVVVTKKGGVLLKQSRQPITTLEKKAIPTQKKSEVKETTRSIETQPVSEPTEVTSIPVFGHPQATNIQPDKYGHLIPIKVKSPQRVEAYIKRAQKLLDEVQAKLTHAELVMKGKIKGDKASAKRYWNSQAQVEDETIRDLLREQTLPELNRLYKILSKKKETPKKELIPEEKPKKIKEPVTKKEAKSKIDWYSLPEVNYTKLKKGMILVDKSGWKAKVVSIEKKGAPASWKITIEDEPTGQKRSFSLTGIERYYKVFREAKSKITSEKPEKKTPEPVTGFQFKYVDKSRNVVKPEHPSIKDIPFVIRKTYKGWRVSAEKPIKLKDGSVVIARQDRGKFKTLPEAKQFVTKIMENREAVFDEDIPLLNPEGEVIRPVEIDTKHFERVSQVLGKEEGKEILSKPKEEQPISELEDEVEKIVKEVESEEDILKKLQKMQEDLPEDLYQPALIPGYPAKTSSVRERAFTTSRQRAKLFRTTSFRKSDKLLFEERPIRHEIEVAYGRFKEDWTRATSKGKPYVLNVGNTKFVTKAFEKGEIKDTERSQYDFVISALEWVKGTNFKDYIKKGLITQEEAKSRLDFFNKYPEKKLKFSGEQEAGLTNVFRRWLRGEMYRCPLEETPHIASLIENANSVKPLYTMDILLNPTRKTRIDVMERISKGLAYAIADRFMEKATQLQNYNLQTIYSQIKKYALGAYVQALEKRKKSPLIDELLKTGVTPEEAFELVENSHHKLYMKYLEEWWNRDVMDAMGFYRWNTPLGQAGFLFDAVWHLLPINLNTSISGDEIRRYIKEDVHPDIKRFIRAGDEIREMGVEAKHVILLQSLMKKLDIALDQYLKGEINVENTQRILARYWNALIERYAEGNHRVLAKAVAGHVFLSSIRDGVYRYDLRDIDKYKYLNEGFKLFIENHPDAYSALVYLSRNGKDSDLRTIAGILLKFAYTNVILPHVPVEFDKSLYGRGITGVYSPSRATFGQIRIDPYASPDDFEIAMFHEILHSLTLHALHYSPEHREQISGIIKDVRKFITDNEYKLGKFIIDNAGKMSVKQLLKKAQEFIDKDKTLQKHIAEYGKESWLLFLRSLHSPDEFIATAISEPNARAFLEKKDTRSIWRKILDVIKNLLGIPTEETDLFVRTIDTLLDVVDKSRPNLIALYRLEHKLEVNDKLMKLAKASTQDLINLAKQVINEVDIEHKRLRLSDFGVETVKDFMSQIKNYTPPPQMKDITSEIRKRFGLPFWTALEYPEFKPLFDHVNRVMENKNFLLHELLETGEKYFTQVDEKRRKYVDAVIRFSDAFQVYLTDKQLKEFPKIVSKVKTAFNQMYYFLQKGDIFRVEEVLHKLNRETGLNLPREYGIKEQHVIRFKHFFDYANLPCSSLTKEEIEAYHNYREITKKTINHIADTFLTLVSRLVVENYYKANNIKSSEPDKIMMINRLFKMAKDLEKSKEHIAKALDKDAREVWEELLSDIEDNPLYKKYLNIKELIDKTAYYSPRYRDPDASDMIVVVNKKMFMEEYRKAYKKYQNREKALQVAYQAVANNDGVYLRQHLKRLDPDYVKKVQHAKKVFRGEKFLVRVLPNYRLAESVMYGNISEGDIGAFLSTVAEKVKAGKVDTELLNELVNSIGNTIQQELLAKSKASQRFIHRSPYLILGYEMDNTKEDTFNYIFNATNYTARFMALFDGLPLLNKIDPHQQRNLRDYAHKWFFDQLKPQSGFDKIVGKVKSYMFMWYLGGLIRPALVQATQMFISTIPLASTTYNIPLRKSLSLFTKAYKDIIFHRELDKNPNLTEDERKFLQITYNSGVTTAQFINQMRDEVAGRGEAFTKLTTALSTPFAYMEEANRLATALGIYRLLKKRGIIRFPTDRRAIAEATDFINMTHYLMGKINLPPVATGGDVSSGLARLALTFRSFTLNLIESYNYMLRHYTRSGKSLFGLNKKGLEFVGYSMLAFGLFGGLFAIPFLDDILQLIERLTGTPIRKNIVKMVGDPDSPLAISVERGLPASLFGIDLSGSLKIEAPKRPADLLNAVFGVYGGLAKSFTDALVALDGYDSLNVLFRVLPQFLANPVRAYEAYKGIKNQYNKPVLDENGKPIKLTEGEALLLALGIRPTRLGRTYFYKSTSRNIDMYFSAKKKAIYNKFRSARTPAERYQVMKMIIEYNKEASKFVSIPKITTLSLRTAIKPVRDKLAQELKVRGF